MPAIVPGTFTCHPFVPHNAGMVVPISQMGTLRPRQVRWLVADPAFPLALSEVSVGLRAAQIGLGRGTGQDAFREASADWALGAISAPPRGLPVSPKMAGSAAQRVGRLDMVFLQGA